MQGQNLSKISTTVIQFFKETVSEIDKAVKFVKRQSKLNANLFSESLVIGCMSHQDVSLEDMCQLLSHRGVEITKQGVHDRFNSRATKLMQVLFLKSLQQFKIKNEAVIDLVKPFSSVEILDSSGISLPESLKDTYPGFGGAASEAGLKIQVLMDYISGQISGAQITRARMNDQCFKEHLKGIKEGALYLQDLGYFKIDSFIKINASGGYFLSRYLSKTSLFEEDNDKPIELLKLLRGSGNFFAKEVMLGSGKDKVKVRLIASRLAEEEVERRIRKIKRLAEKKGKRPTRKTLELAKWSICITNVGEDILKDDQVYLLYSLRWQIEIFFKLCKREGGIDKVSGRKVDRVLCEIYGKLICIVMLLYICFPARWLDSRELSFKKAYKQMRQRILFFFRALKSRYCLIKFLEEFLSNLKEFGLKDKHRKKGRSTYQKLMDATGQEVLA